MGNSFKVAFDFKPAEVTAGRLERLATKALVRLSAVDAVNEVTTRFEGEARKGMNAGLNLSDQYVASKMSTTLATGTTARAQIVARGDLTILGRYPHAQLTAPAPHGRKGDASRGIAPGRKAAGVAVEIRRGAASAQPAWFTMRLRVGAQGGQNVGVFTRTSRGLKHIYGPSPYSLFRYQINERTDALTDDLERTAAARAVDALEGVFR